MAFIKKNIALGATIGEIYRKDRWEYPLEAIHEALINAVITVTPLTAVISSRTKECYRLFQ